MPIKKLSKGGNFCIFWAERGKHLCKFPNDFLLGDNETELTTNINKVKITLIDCVVFFYAMSHKDISLIVSIKFSNILHYFI